MKQGTTISNAKTSSYWWFTGFIILLVLIPLPFGSNRPWASNLFGLAVSILLAGTAWQMYSFPQFMGENFPAKRLIASAVMVSFTVFWAFIQILPITPASWQHPLWKEAADLVNVSGSISIDPGMFPESMIRILGYIGCFSLALYGGHEGKRAAQMVKTVTFAVLVYAIYGLLMQAFDIQYILWFPKWIYQGSVTSTFVNRNSYATYAGMGFLCSLAFLIDHFKDRAIHKIKASKQSRLAIWAQQLTLKDIFYCFIPIIILGSLIMTSSRAGIFSTVVGFVAFVTAYAINQRKRDRVWTSLLITGTILFITLVVIGGENLSARTDEELLKGDMSIRVAAYKLGAQAIADNPWLGSGLGTFENAFRLYRDNTLPLWFQHAHNDYIEIAIELGLPATLSFFAAIGILIACCVQGLWKRKKLGEIPALGVAASVLICVHASADFSMQIPAVAATYASILGLGVSQSWSSRKMDTVHKVPDKKRRHHH